jgi:hypothetical protein
VWPSLLSSTCRCAHTRWTAPEQLSPPDLPLAAVHALLQVANYCVTKLAELNVPLCTHEVGLSPDSQQPPLNSGKQYLELTCNGLVSHWDKVYACRKNVYTEDAVRLCLSNQGGLS